MNVLSEKFSKAQLELIQLFASELPESDLVVLKKILLRFKAERLMDSADKIWEGKNWSNEDIKRLLEIRMHTSYKRKNRS